MVSSESNKVNKIIEFLKNKCNFAKDLLVSHPNKEDIKNKSIQKALSTASKTEKGKRKNPGKLDIYYCNEKKKFLFLAEVKPEVSQHEEAIEDIKHYLSFFESLSAEYKIVGLAVSGDIETDDHEITSFIVEKNEVTEKTRKDRLWTEKRYLYWFETPNDEKRKEILEKIKKIANKVSKLLMSLDSAQKPIIVAGTLLSLYQREEKNERIGSIREKIREKIIERKNPKFQKQLANYNESLKGKEIIELSDEIRNNFFINSTELTDKSSDLEIILKEELGVNKKINDVIRIIREAINKPELANNEILANVFLRIYQMYELLAFEIYDVNAIFYQIFLKHWKGDSDKGKVLTPWHVAELMVELIDKFKEGGITKDDICLDPCAGTGTFLLAFMNRQRKKFPESAEQVKQNLIGVEMSDNMFVLSLASMLISGDGKSNLHEGDCFDPWKFTRLNKENNVEENIEPTIGLMNPPYSLSKQKTSNSRKEIEFVENLLSLVNGYVAVIIPIHTFNSKKVKIESRKGNKKRIQETKAVTFKEFIYSHNKLKAVINMPQKLFHPINFKTFIAIFQTGKGHTKEDKVYFYNLENDGYKVIDGVRKDESNQWEKIEEKLLKDVEKRQTKEDEAFYCGNITEKDRWNFNYHLKKFKNSTPKKIQKNFKILYAGEGKKHFEKTIADYLLYKIEEKSGILEKKLKINEAKEKGDIKEKKRWEEKQPIEWLNIYQYLLYKWKESGSNLELKTSDNISDSLRFLKKLVFADLNLEEIKFGVKNIEVKSSWERVLEKQKEVEKLDRKVKEYSSDLSNDEIFLIKKKIEQLENEIYQQLNLSNRKLGMFQLGNEKYFQVEKAKKTYAQNKFQKERIKWGNYNYVTTAEYNNGVARKVNKKPTNEGKVITIATNGKCLSFYQNEPFLTNSDVAILNIRDYPMNTYIGLFINTLLDFNRRNIYDWSYKRSLESIKEEWIMLPVNDQGEPDWEFMHIYIYIYIAKRWLKRQEYKNCLFKTKRNQEKLSFKSIHEIITDNYGRDIYEEVSNLTFKTCGSNVNL